MCPTHTGPVDCSHGEISDMGSPGKNTVKHDFTSRDLPSQDESEGLHTGRVLFILWYKVHISSGGSRSIISVSMVPVASVVLFRKPTLTYIHLLSSSGVIVFIYHQSASLNTQEDRLCYSLFLRHVLYWTKFFEFHSLLNCADTHYDHLKLSHSSGLRWLEEDGKGLYNFVMYCLPGPNCFLLYTI